MKKFLDGEEIETALDLGCGYGRVTPWVGEFVSEVKGIDPNPETIEIAQSHYPHFDFRVASGQQLPYEDGTFDLVLTWTVLQHVPPEEIENVTVEIQRVLRSGAWFLALEDTEQGFSCPDSWPRSKAEYANLMDQCRMEEVETRNLPWTDKKSDLRVLFFEKT